MSGHETDPAHGEAGGGTAQAGSIPDSVKPTLARKWISLYHQNEALYLFSLHTVTITVVFLPSLQNHFVNYDDPGYVTANPHVQHGLTMEGIRWAFVTNATGNWHPLTWLSHMADCQFFGQKSWGHHLTNVLLHALNTGLLFLVLQGMTGALWRSVFVACLFGLHPLHVQSVAWVSERKDVLSALFWMLTLLAYAFYAKKSKLRYGEVQTQPHTTRRELPLAFWYLLTVGFFALGLMSKPMVVTLPFVLLLLDYWPLARVQASPDVGRGIRNLWSLTLEKIPFFALAIATSTITFLVQKDSGAMRKLGGLYSLGARVDNAVIGYCRYLGKLFYPLNLAPFYPYPSAWQASQVVLAASLLLGVSAIAIWLRRQRPYLLVGWLWYLGTLVPVIGLIQVGGQSIADRYTYIPLIGIFLLLVWGIHDLTRRWHHQRSNLAVAAVVILLLCMAITRWQIGFWADSETLFRRALSITSDNALARVNLGMALAEKGRPEALEELNAALRFTPNDPELKFTVGKALVALGYSVEAIILLQESLALEPGRGPCHLALGLALERTGHPDEAILHYREAIRLNPELLDARNDLGLALCNKTQFGEAIDQFKQALRLEPNSPETHNFLGFALAQAGRTEEAISQYRYAIKLKPDFAEAYSRLGVVYLLGGEFDEAIQQFRRALALNPDYADAHINLGAALSNKGDLDGAANEFRLALASEPNNALARKNLDYILSKKSGSAPP
jgi:tetratricopeptide (TPR) repeat protein